MSDAKLLAAANAARTAPPIPFDAIETVLRLARDVVNRDWPDFGPIPVSATLNESAADTVERFLEATRNG